MKQVRNGSRLAKLIMGGLITGILAIGIYFLYMAYRNF